MRFLLSGAAVWLLVGVVVGCGGDGLPPRVPVSGMVTFDGAPPPAAGYVNFAQLEVFGEGAQRPASARFETDGKFVAGSYGKTDGLLPGRYRVTIECWKHDPQPIPGGEEAATWIAPGYQPSELLVERHASAITDLRYDVPRRP